MQSKFGTTSSSQSVSIAGTMVGRRPGSIAGNGAVSSYRTSGFPTASRPGSGLPRASARRRRSGTLSSRYSGLAARPPGSTTASTGGTPAPAAGVHHGEHERHPRHGAQLRIRGIGPVGRDLDRLLELSVPAERHELERRRPGSPREEDHGHDRGGSGEHDRQATSPGEATDL